jgi:hypothetical protein
VVCRIVGGGDGDKKKLKLVIDSDRCVSVVCVLVGGLHVDEVVVCVLAARSEVACVLGEAVYVLCATPALFPLFWQICVSVILVSFSPAVAAVAVVVVLAWASATRRLARRLRWDRAGEELESHRPQRRP